MRGYLGNNNYFTRQCCGVLQDLEYSINYNSPWVYNGSISFYPSITYNNINIKSDFDFNNIENTQNIENNIQNIQNNIENNNFKNNLLLKYKFKCKCCLDISNTINKIDKI